ncbi:Histone deacetylase 4 [Schistosoma japonicum]|uniref:histone deacetylase n=1 Tax=Schistosoma japonicum TaxID=6182 RepID=A0A4Z2D341_SCHJA|nr:Histone deacetylase 4 [Schistosoma japonicum]
MDQKEPSRKVESVKSTSLVELSSSTGHHSTHHTFTKGSSTETYSSIRSGDDFPLSTSYHQQSTMSSDHPSTLSSNPSRSSFLSRQVSFDQGGEGRLSSTQVKQRLKAYLLNRRRGRILNNQHWRTDSKLPGSSQIPYTESDFDENLELSGSDSGQHGMFHVVDHWHSADSPSFSEWDLADENLPVHQHHSLDLDMQRKLTDFNASTKPTCPSSNFEHIPHSSSFFQSGYMPSFSSVNTKDLDEEYSTDNNVTNATTDAQTLGSVELEKSNHQFLERLNYHLVSKSDGRLNNEQVQAMIALFKMISQSKEQLKKTGLQPTSLEEKSVNRNDTHHWQHNVYHRDDGDLRQLREYLPFSDVGTNVNYHEALSVLVKLYQEASKITPVQPNLVESHQTSSVNKSHSSFCVPNQMDWESQLSDSVKSNSTFSSEINPTTQQNISSTNMDSGGDGEKCIDDDTVAPNPIVNNINNNLSNIYHQSYKLASDIWSALPENDWLSQSHHINPKTSRYPNLTTAIAFDPEMLEHKCLCHSADDPAIHPECPNRLSCALERLVHAPLRIPSHMSSYALNDLIENFKITALHDMPDLQYDFNKFLKSHPDIPETLITHLPLLAFCRLVRARMATEDELQIFHSTEYVQTFGTIPTVSSDNHRSSSKCSIESPSPTVSFGSTTVEHGLSLFSLSTRASLSNRLCSLACGGVGVDSDTVWNPYKTARAARLAVGQVLCLAHQVAKHHIRNGFAIVRPPGHHAEPDQAMGFCYFNSVAIAALHLLRERIVSKVLIIDWDIHHGNGTKLATTHPGLVYLSLHRYDNGTFFPGTGSVSNCMEENQLSRINSCDSDHTSTTTATYAPNSDCNISLDKSKSFDNDIKNNKKLDSSSAQLINVAWENPYSNNDNAYFETLRSLMKRRSTSSSLNTYSLNADERRKRWFQNAANRSTQDKQKYGKSSGSNNRPSFSDQSNFKQIKSSSSASSFFFRHSMSIGSRHNSDTIPFCTCQPNKETSTGSSRVCSYCLSQSIESSSERSDCLLSETNPIQLQQQHSAQHAPLLSNTYQHQHPHSVAPNEPLLGLSDAEYLAAMRSIVIPVGHEFQPDIILISAGYDAAFGHGEALGGYSVSAGLFAWITHQCMSISNSRIVLALEGGYCPTTVADCITSCVNALLLPASQSHWMPVLNIEQPNKCVNINGAQEAWMNALYWIPKSELIRPPRPEAVVNLMTTIRHHAKTGWKCFTNVSEETVAMSFSEAIHMEHQLYEMNKCNEFNSIKSRKLSDDSIPSLSSSSSSAPITTSTSSSSTTVVTASTAAYRFSNSLLSDYMAKLHMDQS